MRSEGVHSSCAQTCRVEDVGGTAERPQEVTLRVHREGNGEPINQTTFKGKTSLCKVSQFSFMEIYIGIKMGRGPEGQRST